MSFGETIKRLRREKGMTQDQLANLLNVTPQAVSRWENNSAMPDISQLVPIANVFKVSTDTLLEVNVEETENQIQEALDRALNFDGKSRPGYYEGKVTELREAIRRFPQDIRLKRMLVSMLAGMILKQEPNPDPAIIREQISLLEDIIEAETDKDDLEHDRALLVSDYERLKNPERINDIAEDAPRLEVCREVLLPGALKGEAQVRARKDLIFRCADEIICTIYELCEENAGDLTDEEWDELNRAQGVIAALYGEGFSDYYVLVTRIYSQVCGALKRGRPEEACDVLEDIVRRLKLKDTNTDVPESSLLLDTAHMNLIMSYLSVFHVPYDARVILERVRTDFDPEQLESPRLRAICEDLEELSAGNGGAFTEYCQNKMVEYFLNGTLKKENEGK